MPLLLDRSCIHQRLSAVETQIFLPFSVSLTLRSERQVESTGRFTPAARLIGRGLRISCRAEPKKRNLKTHAASWDEINSPHRVRYALTNPVCLLSSHTLSGWLSRLRRFQIVVLLTHDLRESRQQFRTDVDFAFVAGRQNIPQA